MINSISYRIKLGKVLQRRRKQQGLSQEQLSELCDVHKNTIQRIETAVHKNPKCLMRVVEELYMRKQA